MNLLSHLWQCLADWFAEATLAAASGSGDLDPTQDAQADEARRTSIHEVTREQLGLAHWSCHTHF